MCYFFFSSRRRHTRYWRDWSSDVCSSDLRFPIAPGTDGGTPQEVHARQHYELVDWRRADDQLNYRRFFAINTLAGLRVEDPEVFRATHALIVELVENGSVDALRIDHPDGLADPKGYLDALAAATGDRW